MHAEPALTTRPGVSDCIQRQFAYSGFAASISLASGRTPQILDFSLSI